MKAIFKRQDLFLDRTYKDYTAENISPLDIFKPHFEWKKEKHSSLPPFQNSRHIADELDITQRRAE